MAKKYFVTGLVMLLPAVLTIAIVIFVFNFLTIPFTGIVKNIFEHYHIFEKGFLFLSTQQIQQVIAQFFILIGLLLFTVLLGWIASWFFFRYLLRLGDYVVKKIPLIRSIYRTSQEVIKTIFTSTSKSFKQVVLVRFPNPETYSIGLITREEMPHLKDTDHQDAVAVFVPTTPNPTSGFLVLYKREDLIFLDMRVEDAFKYIISCGTILPNFDTLSQEEVIKINSGEDQ